MTMRRIALLLIAGLAGFAGWHLLLRDRAPPSAQTIKEIEALVVMPTGAQTIEHYDRYYSYGWKGWRPNVVVGVFLLLPDGIRRGATPVQGVPGAYTIPTAPIVFDGGCSVVTVYYDEQAKRLLPTERGGKPEFAICNGV